MSESPPASSRIVHREHCVARDGQRAAVAYGHRRWRRPSSPVAVWALSAHNAGSESVQPLHVAVAVAGMDGVWCRRRGGDRAHARTRQRTMGQHERTWSSRRPPCAAGKVVLAACAACRCLRTCVRGCIGERGCRAARTRGAAAARKPRRPCCPPPPPAMPTRGTHLLLVALCTGNTVSREMGNARRWPTGTDGGGGPLLQSPCGRSAHTMPVLRAYSHSTWRRCGGGCSGGGGCRAARTRGAAAARTPRRPCCPPTPPAMPTSGPHLLLVA